MTRLGHRGGSIVITSINVGTGEEFQWVVGGTSESRASKSKSERRPPEFGIFATLDAVLAGIMKAEKAGSFSFSHCRRFMLQRNMRCLKPGAPRPAKTAYLEASINNI